MPFQFVNTTADKRTPDATTRRQIRSQVMKDYRKRREDGTDHTVASGSLPPSRPQYSRSPSSSTLYPSTPPQGNPAERSNRKGRPSKSEQQQAASLFLQTAHGLFSNFTVRLGTVDASRLRVAQHNTSYDYRETSQMLVICDRFNRWLNSPQTQVATLLATQQNLSSAVSMQRLYAQTLLSIGHLSGIDLVDVDELRAYCKTRTLEHANASLQDEETACSDSTLAALACLTSYEISFGSHEALTHLSGIARIVDWRGGLHNIDDEGLVLLLEALDLLHAVYFHVNAALTTSTQSWAENDDSADAAREWQDQLREAASYLHGQGYVAGSRACYLSWQILLLQPTETEIWPHDAIAVINELFLLMRDIETWSAQPALQARVLLTGLATASDPAQKAWYYTSLSYLIFHTEARYWYHFKTLVQSFIKSQTFYRRPVVQMVRAIVSGVEIVIERNLASQLGLQTVSS